MTTTSFVLILENVVIKIQKHIDSWCQPWSN